jgi:hypothetical protein
MVPNRIRHISQVKYRYADQFVAARSPLSTDPRRGECVDSRKAIVSFFVARATRSFASMVFGNRFTRIVRVAALGRRFSHSRVGSVALVGGSMFQSNCPAGVIAAGGPIPLWPSDTSCADCVTYDRQPPFRTVGESSSSEQTILATDSTRTDSRFTISARSPLARAPIRKSRSTAVNVAGRDPSRRVRKVSRRKKTFTPVDGV